MRSGVIPASEAISVQPPTALNYFADHPDRLGRLQVAETAEVQEITRREAIPFPVQAHLVLVRPGAAGVVTQSLVADYRDYDRYNATFVMLCKRRRELLVSDLVTNLRPGVRKRLPCYRHELPVIASVPERELYDPNRV